MVHLNSDVLVTLPLLHLHTDKNARDATFINSYRVTPLVAGRWPYFHAYVNQIQ